MVGCSRGRDVAAHNGAIIYGTDGRQELFELDSLGWQQRAAQSAVAFIPEANLISSGTDGALGVSAETWRAREGLCDSERFGDQPAAAFCSGVLVDWDLVLTAGHCMRVLPFDQYRAVFGYYYSSPGVLARLQAYRVADIVAEKLDPPESSPRLDYAFVRLERPVEAPAQPSPLRRAPYVAPEGAPLVTMGMSGGVPLKVDDSGRVLDGRAGARDYFVADTDTDHGASGAGAFDEELSLLGVLARGENDFVESDDGCLVSSRASQPNEGGEQFTYVSSALPGLCGKAPETSLCRGDCGEPCEALPFPRGGCSLSGSGGTETCSASAFVVVTLLLGVRRRRASRRGRESASRRPTTESTETTSNG